MLEGGNAIVFSFSKIRYFVSGFLVLLYLYDIHIINAGQNCCVFLFHHFNVASSLTDHYFAQESRTGSTGAANLGTSSESSLCHHAAEVVFVQRASVDLGRDYCNWNG